MKNYNDNLIHLKLFLSNKEEIKKNILHSSIPDVITKLHLTIPPTESFCDYYSYEGIMLILTNMLKMYKNTEQQDLRNGDVYLKVYCLNSPLYNLPVLCLDIFFFKELSSNTTDLLKLKIKTDLLVFTRGHGYVEFIKGVDLGSIQELLFIPNYYSFESFVKNDIVIHNFMNDKIKEQMDCIVLGLLPIMKLDIRQLFDNPDYSVFKNYKDIINNRKTLFYHYL